MNEKAQDKEAVDSSGLEGAAETGEGIVGCGKNLCLAKSSPVVLTRDLASAGDVGVELQCLFDDDSNLLKAICNGRLKSENN